MPVSNDIEDFFGPREALQKRAMELGLPFVELDRVKPDAEAQSSLPLELIQRHRVLPLKKAGNRIWVAMADVHDAQAIEELQQATGCTINPCVCDAESLDQTIEALSPTT